MGEGADDLDMFDDLDGGDAGGDDAGSDAGADDAGKDAPPPKESKRVSDLTSKWQKAEARAAKAEAALAKAGSKSDQASGGDDQPDPVKAEREEWITAQREFLRERALASDPRFEAYGIELEDIAGDSPAEMKASVKRYQALIDSVETKARARLLQEYGLNPEISGQAMDPKLDIDSMGKDDFEKLVDKARGWR